MTVRQIVYIWFAAFGIAAALIYTIMHYEIHRSGHADKMTEIAPVVAIGTSLFQYAIPANRPEGGILGDGRDHALMQIWGREEHRTASIITDVAEKGAKTILIEINPLVFDFAYHHDSTEAPFYLNIADDILNLSAAGRGAVRRLLTESTSAGPDIDKPSLIDPDILKRLYPLRLRSGQQAVAVIDAINAAKVAGAEVFFIAPPRASTATTYIGAANVAALVAHQKDFAERLSVPLVPLAPSWPDNHFVDQAHVNRRGRNRFRSELQAWWQGR